jgi:MurNAc alpha-1-phosphate uridylyltransferase
MNLQAFILAAGLGTRLRPLTDTIPKPMVALAGKPLLVRHLDRLSSEGFEEVMINLHYLPDKIKEFVGDGKDWNLSVSYSFEPTLLDTGGGVKNIEEWIKGDSLLIINSDSVFDDSFSFKSVLREHHSLPDTKLTLLVGPSDEQYTPLFIDGGQNLVGFGRSYVPKDGETTVAYLGVMVISSSLLKAAPAVGTPFSLTADIIPGLLARKEKIRTVKYDGFWSDVGTPERLESASKYFTV